jgi:undecaprenyl-diphosphatase
MDLIQITVLALVQGLTEFLPISSSAHLILVPVLTDWEDQGLAFDVAVHVGTLSAVVWYFRAELQRMTLAWFGSVAGRGLDPDSRLAWAVIFGTLPAALAGLLFHDFIGEHLRSPLVIAATTLIFGLLLAVADKTGTQRRDEHSIHWLDVALIGGAQALALIPGTSRSGITMAVALLVGLTRTGAARFSFLLSVPIILLAGGYESLKLVQAGMQAQWLPMVLGALVSGLSAYLCIHFFLKLLDRIGFMPFVYYRLGLGVLLLVLFL